MRLAVIAEARIELTKGLNCFTGATGAVIFTSATLTAGGSFSYTRSRLGLAEDAAESCSANLARDIGFRDGRFEGAQLFGSAEHWSLLEGHCVDCHNSEDWFGQLSFEFVDRENVASDAALWENVIRKYTEWIMTQQHLLDALLQGRNGQEGLAFRRLDGGDPPTAARWAPTPGKP